MQGLFASKIRERDPEAAQETVDALACVYSDCLDRMLKRILASAQAGGRRVMHRNARPDAVLQLANLALRVAEMIIETRAKGRCLRELLPEEERVELERPGTLASVEAAATAQWSKAYDRIAAEHPILATPSRTSMPPLQGGYARQRQPPPTRHHYVPQFTVRPWTGNDGKVMLFKRERGGGVVERLVTPKSWGYDFFLYDQHLEEQFSLIENRAETCYRKLRNTVPLSPEDRYFWISFLLVQYYRTPSFMARLAVGLRRWSAKNGLPHDLTAETLRRAYSTLFDDDHLFASSFRRLDRRRWRVLIASGTSPFPRTDCPFAPTGRLDQQGWGALYPLSPTECLQIGPEFGVETDVPAALSSRVDDAEALRLANYLVGQSRRSFVVHAQADARTWRTIAERCLPLSDPIGTYRAWGRPEL